MILARPLLPLLALALLVAVPAAAETGPSFDCSKASTVVERQICDNDVLGAFDGWVARLYTGLRGELDATAKDQLKVEQRAWLKDERNACAKAEPRMTGETKDGAIYSCLYRAYERRAVQLAQAVETLLYDVSDPATALSGSYGYDDGYSSASLLLLQMADGSVVFEISSVNGPASHICEVQGEEGKRGPDLVLWSDTDESQCKITFASEDGGLRVTATDGCQYYCGANAYFAGLYERDPL